MNRTPDKSYRWVRIVTAAGAVAFGLLYLGKGSSSPS